MSTSYSIVKPPLHNSLSESETSDHTPRYFNFHQSPIPPSAIHMEKLAVEVSAVAILCGVLTTVFFSSTLIQCPSWIMRQICLPLCLQIVPLMSRAKTLFPNHYCNEMQYLIIKNKLRMLSTNCMTPLIPPTAWSRISHLVEELLGLQILLTLQCDGEFWQSGWRKVRAAVRARLCFAAADCAAMGICIE